MAGKSASAGVRRVDPFGARGRFRSGPRSRARGARARDRLRCAADGAGIPGEESATATSTSFVTPPPLGTLILAGGGTRTPIGLRPVPPRGADELRRPSLRVAVANGPLDEGSRARDVVDVGHERRAGDLDREGSDRRALRGQRSRRDSSPDSSNSALVSLARRRTLLARHARTMTGRPSPLRITTRASPTDAPKPSILQRRSPTRPRSGRSRARSRRRSWNRLPRTQLPVPEGPLSAAQEDHETLGGA